MGKTRALWSDEMKKIFLDLCIEQVNLGGKPGTSLKPRSWRKVIEAFDRKTGVKYDQKQLKNQWDLMKRHFKAWKKLLNQTDIGHNAVTHAVTMEPKRWAEYLKTNRDAKPFRVRPLQFVEEMEILFGGKSAMSKNQHIPASTVTPDDVVGSAPNSADLTLNVETESPGLSAAPINERQDGEEETTLDEQLYEMRRKRPRLLREEERVDKVFSNLINRVLEMLLKVSGTKGPTIEECIASLKPMPNVDSKMYSFALIAFRAKENREIWMAEEDPVHRMNFLQLLMNESFPKGPTITECVTSLKQMLNLETKMCIFALRAFRVKQNREIWMAEEDPDMRMKFLQSLMEDESSSSLK